MTNNLVVSDSSTLILAVRAEFIDVVLKKFSVFIPEIVFHESVVKGKEIGRWDAFKIEKLVENNLIKVSSPSNGSLQVVSSNFNLHKGELHALALAIDVKAEFVLTDDLKAMNACKVLGIKFTNAISLLLTMYENKKLSKKSANACFFKLEEFGWYHPKIIIEFKKIMKKE